MSLHIELDLHLSSLQGAAGGVTPEALAKAMEHIREVAVERTPLEEGTLRRSAKVTVDGDQAAIHYDGPYARRQHEELDYRHEVGQAKFLESALISEADTALNIIATEIKRAL